MDFQKLKTLFNEHMASAGTKLNNAVTGSTDLASKYQSNLVGGLAGMAVGGGLGAYATDTEDDRTPEQKRRHRWRNAITGAVAGGAVGAATPTVANRFFGPDDPKVDTVVGKAWSKLKGVAKDLNPANQIKVIDKNTGEVYIDPDAQRNQVLEGGGILGTAGYMSGRTWDGMRGVDLKNVDQRIKELATARSAHTALHPQPPPGPQPPRPPKPKKPQGGWPGGTKPTRPPRPPAPAPLPPKWDGLDSTVKGKTNAQLAQALADVQAKIQNNAGRTTNMPRMGTRAEMRRLGVSRGKSGLILGLGGTGAGFGLPYILQGGPAAELPKGFVPQTE